ncbi:MAG: SusC/RagA family TonB-linked outer membrane protein [Ginsengibacter sp.]
MKNLILFLCCILALSKLFAQKAQIVSGIIINNEDNKPVYLASVSAINKGATTTTDRSGLFKISISQFTDTLIITHIGFSERKLVVTSGSTNIRIALQPFTTQLEEVSINTGYQKLKPNEVNGSYVVVDSKMLNRQTSTNILDRLNGVTSGLIFNSGKRNPNPQNNTNITIRGLSTINGPLDPLVVVDNFIYDGDINNINPNDVESVTVLKDAAATSIWGARAGNGVIVITTKKGKFNEKLKLDFNSSITIKDKPDLYYLPQISSSDYINLEQFLLKQGYYDNQVNNYAHPPLSPAVEIMIARGNGEITAADSASRINALKKIDSREQFMKYFYRKGLTEQYDLTLHGGSSNLAWLLSGSFDKDISNLKAEYNKMNVRFENTYRPFKNLDINAGLYYTDSKSISGEQDFYSTSSITGSLFVPYLQFADWNNNPLPVTYRYRSSYIDTAGNGKLLDWHYYPLDDWKHSNYEHKINEIIANVGLNYRFTPNLDFLFRYQYQQQNGIQKSLNDTSSFYTRDKINLFTQIDEDGVVKNILPVGGILIQSGNREFSQNLRTQINFHKRSGFHNLNALAGFESRETGNSSNSNTYYGYFDDPLIFNNVDVINYYPTYVTGSYAQLSGSGRLSETNYRFASFFSNASYSFKSRYSISGSMRKDGSNIFGAKTNDKWKPLWSAGLGWTISKEPFYNFTGFPHLRVNITTGSSGNVDVTKIPMPVAGQAISYATGLPFMRINSLNNPDLKWEEITQTNLRIEFATIENRIWGSLEYYFKKGTDLYGLTPYDYTAWGVTPTITKNVAEMKGNGIDFTLSSQNSKGVVNWGTNFLFNYNKSETTKYYSDLKNPVSQAIGGGNIINPIVGKPLYSIFAYRWGGLDKSGNPQGYIENQKTTDYLAITNNVFDKGMSGGSIVYKGPASPVIFGNLINSLTWGHFQLDLNISYELGYYLFRPALSYSALVKDGMGNGEYVNRWQNAGDEDKTAVPSFIYPVDSRRDNFYQISEINVIKGDNIRLRYINLGYDIRAAKNMPFKNIQAFINLSNLGIIWQANKDHIDPDYGSSIPLPTTFTVGFRSGF